MSKHTSGWVLEVSAAAMAMGLLSLICGTLVYRNKPPQGSILTTIAQIEGDLDVKLSSYAKLGACFTQGGYMDASSLTLGSSRSCKSMEMEIQLLLKKLLDITSLECNFQSGFTGLVQAKHTLASYSFSGLQISKWLYLDSKLMQDCRLVKQLPVSECSHDDIKQLEWVNFQQ